MTRRLRRATSITALVVLGAVTTVGCTGTVIEGETTPTGVVSSTTSTTSTLPTALPELLDSMGVTLAAIAEAIIGEGDQRALLGYLEGLWSAAQPQVEAIDTQIAEDMEAMVELARTAVNRTRPADADKAGKFFVLLADDLLART